MKSLLTLVLIIPFVLAVCAFGQIGPAPIVITNVTVIDGTGATWEHMSIEIRGGKIWDIAPKIEPKPGEKVIDQTGKFVMPGLIDTRVQLGVSPANHMFRGETALEQRVAWLHSLIKSGVTTARLIQGDLAEQNVYKRFRNDDQLIAPALIASGPTLTAKDGSPADQYGLLGSALRQREVFEADTAIEGRDKARAVAHNGGDVFEIMYSKGPESNPAPRLKDDALSAMLKEAHGHELRAFCWVGTNAEATTALASGCDVLEGASEEVLSDEVLKQMVAKGVPFVPSLLYQGYLMTHFLDPDALKAYLEQPLVAEGLSPLMHKSLESKTGQLGAMRKLSHLPVGASAAEIRAALAADKPADPKGSDPGQPHKTTLGDLLVEQSERSFENVKRAKAAGVKIMIGTGAGSLLDFPGSSVHQEMKVLVNELGFTPAEALQAATVNAAAGLGKQSDIGTVEKERLADFVILDANPLIDIANAAKISAVVRAGRLLKLDDLETY